MRTWRPCFGCNEKLVWVYILTVFKIFLLITFNYCIIRSKLARPHHFSFQHIASFGRN
jgi:hypothetical protein